MQVKTRSALRAEQDLAACQERNTDLGCLADFMKWCPDRGLAMASVTLRPEQPRRTGQRKTPEYGFAAQLPDARGHRLDFICPSPFISKPKSRVEPLLDLRSRAEPLRHGESGCWQVPWLTLNPLFQPNSPRPGPNGFAPRRRWNSWDVQETKYHAFFHAHGEQFRVLLRTLLMLLSLLLRFSLPLCSLLQRGAV